MTDHIDTSTLVERLRTQPPVHGPSSSTQMLREEAADEIERLRERCKAYKGQIEAGAIAIEHLRNSPDSKSALVISKERIKTTVGLVLAKNKWPIHQTYDDAGLDYEEYEEFVGEVLALLLPSGEPSGRGG